MLEGESLDAVLQKNVQYLKGVGPAKSKALAGLGIFTLDDLLTHYPRRYEDRRKITPVAELVDGEVATVQGTVARIDESSPRRKLRILKVAIGDGTGYIQLTWFNQPYLKRKFSIGQTVIATGKADRSYHYWAMNTAEYEILDDAANAVARIQPIYKVNEAVPQKFIRGLLAAMKEMMQALEENLPAQIIAAYGLCSRRDAVLQIHFPEDEEKLQRARYRLAFEELYFIQCGMALLKRRYRAEQKGVKHLLDSSLTRQVRGRIPFPLTRDQEKALREICFNMEQAVPMQRLLQGDVGSGKTVVAALALTKTVENGYQGALMAPTEILARQHFEALEKLLSPAGIKVVLLTGGLTKKKRELVLEEIENGAADIVIGTHALLQEDIQFHSLGLAVTDEQHRFGVRQRSLLRQKGACPDVLVMTATPIPRTMMLTVYGDLDVSMIKELPPGRKPVRTFVRQPDRRDKIYQFVRREIEKGRQAYVVCPLIEMSDTIETASVEELYEEISDTYLRGVRCGLIHGRLPAEQKKEVMETFYRGELKVLVATTVIEVGVNVPNASIMVVEGAERFGLAQLHQLRGRIGRGEYQSYCILVSQGKSDVTRKRLSIMENTADGFLLAEEDLKLRGPGQFFGTRQHGMPDLKIADLVNDIDILLSARKAALETIQNADLRAKALNYVAAKYRGYFGELDESEKK